MAGWRVEGTLLPEGRPCAGGVDDRGRWVETPPDGSEPLPGRFVLTGLVDAHCHLSVGGGDGRPRPLSLPEARENLLAARDAGIAVVRDLGGPDGVTLRLLEDAGGVKLMPCGRFLAPKGQYFPDLHSPVSADGLIEAALAEIEAGARWVKLIGDFPLVGSGAARPEDAVPTYPVDVVRELVASVHRAGARVAAHTTTGFAGELVAAGVDSIEHGDGMDEADVAALAGGGAAWTPTLCAVVAARPGEDRERRRRRLERRERFAHLLKVAVESGVPILAGTDVVGTVAEEVALLVELGLEPERALAAAGPAAREFLGLPGLRAGDPADLVTFHDDPRDDPSVPARPAAVVVAGRRAGQGR